MHAKFTHGWQMRTERTRLTLAATFDDPVGRVLYQGRSESVAAATVIAVLHAEPSAPLGYFIVTGFVAP